MCITLIVFILVSANLIGPIFLKYQVIFHKPYVQTSPQLKTYQKCKYLANFKHFLTIKDHSINNNHNRFAFHSTFLARIN